MQSQAMSRARNGGANNTAVARPFSSTEKRLVTKDVTPSTGAQPDEWLCTKEVARLTKLSASFFEKARVRGRDFGPPWHKIGGRVRYRVSEVLAWLESCRVTGGESHD